MAISKIKKNSLATGIIDEEVVNKDVINGQTELSSGAASNDTVLIYDTSVGELRKITQTNLLNFPTVSSVSPTNAVSGDGTGNHTFVITGTGFTGATANLINESGNTVSFDSQTVDSATQITGVIAKSSLPGSGEPYDVRVAAASGLASTLANQINVDQSPVYSTAAGSLGSVADGARGSLTFTVVAADPESGGDVVYTLESGSLPAGCSLTSTSSGGVLSGFNAVGSSTTSTFTIRAKDAASNTSDRQFTITVLPPTSQSFTSSGTFTVPTGVTAVDVLVVAGGGGSTDATSNYNGGGGAGGLIYRPGFSVTPGGTVSVTVGAGGTKDETTGQDSVFGTLTAKGGGRGGSHGNTVAVNPGGSGGGAGRDSNTSGGSATQPTQSGESGNYGFGNAGGSVGGSSWYGAGGGGGAGAAGGNGTGGAPNTETAGNGGIGKAYTIADGTTSVYYAGGGGGGQNSSGNGPTNPGTTTAQGGQGGGGTGWHTGRSPNVATPGTANTGGGGGGYGNGNGTSGGKGIVIVRY